MDNLPALLVQDAKKALTKSGSKSGSKAVSKTATKALTKAVVATATKDIEDTATKAATKALTKASTKDLTGAGVSTLAKGAGSTLDGILGRSSGLTLPNYTLPNGIEIPLPKYYKNKLYDESQRNALWTKLLDDDENDILYTHESNTLLLEPLLKYLEKVDKFEKCAKVKKYIDKLNAIE